MQRTKKIAIYFDMMDTLFKDPFPSAAKTCAGSMSSFLKYIKEGNYIDFETGDIDEEEYLTRFFKSSITRQQAPFTAQDFKAELMKTPPMPAERMSLLNRLKKTYFLGLASNYGPWASEHLKNVGLQGFFDVEHISWQMRCRKPAPQYYELIKSGTDFETLYFIDDRNENCEAAEEAGFIAIQAVAGWEEKLANLLGINF